MVHAIKQRKDKEHQTATRVDAEPKKWHSPKETINNVSKAKLAAAIGTETKRGVVLENLNINPASNHKVSVRLWKKILEFGLDYSYLQSMVLWKVEQLEAEDMRDMINKSGGSLNRLAELAGFRVPTKHNMSVLKKRAKVLGLAYGQLRADTVGSKRQLHLPQMSKSPIHKKTPDSCSVDVAALREQLKDVDGQMRVLQKKHDHLTEALTALDQMYRRGLIS